MNRILLDCYSKKVLLDKLIKCSYEQERLYNQFVGQPEERHKPLIRAYEHNHKALEQLIKYKETRRGRR